MTATRCEACRRRRNLRGWRLCDECSYDWWEANGGYEWWQQMADYGWAAVPGDDVAPVVARAALLAEARWSPCPPDYTPSALWDASTPTTGVVGAFVREVSVK